MRVRSSGNPRLTCGCLFISILAGIGLQGQSFTQYPVTSYTNGITAGPDGAMWFTEGPANQIGRISLSGSIKEYPLLTPTANPSHIVTGPDGALWFTEPGAWKIGRISTSGVIVEFPLPACNSEQLCFPQGITSGPDGALWFVDSWANAVGRITTSGTITEFTIPTPTSFPWGIAAGSDGALWFTEYDGGKIGRITTSGLITEYSLLSPTPGEITAGPDGALWFVEDYGKIGRITVSGSVTEYALPGIEAFPVGIAAGPDGALWFTEQSIVSVGNVIRSPSLGLASTRSLLSVTPTSQIGRITTAGVITEYPVPSGEFDPNLIATGPDHALWFTDTGGIGRLGFLSPLSSISCTLPPGAVGFPYSGNCSISGGLPPYTWSATGLGPSVGVNIDPTSGALSGTPFTPGSYPATITVADSSKPPQTALQPFTLTISGSVLTVTCGSPPSGTVGTGYSFGCSASGGVAPYNWYASGLPPGLSINSGSGAITGTPTSTGSYTVGVNVSDASFHATFSQVTITVGAPGLLMTCGTTLSGTVGTAYSLGCSASGGVLPYNWSASGLPPGVSIGAGLLSGSPLSAGSFSATVTVTDSTTPKPQSSSQSITIVISPSPLTLTCSNPAATVSTTYSASCTSSGGTPPFTWVASGLPPGLNINGTTGAITGTPTSSGTYSGTVTVTDSTTPTRQTASAPVSISVTPAKLTMSCSAGSGVSGAAYSGGCSANGGSPPYNWTASGLPSTLSISSSGTLTGTPTTPASYSVTVTVGDSAKPTNQTVSQTFTITISPQPLTVSCSTSSGTAGISYSAGCTANGGTPPYVWTASGLPSGLSISSGVISGTPTSSGPFAVTITVNDSTAPSSQAASTTFSILVNPAPENVTLSQSTSNSLPNQVSLSVAVGQQSNSLAGTLKVNFKIDPSVTNVPANYVDPSAGFAVGGSTATALNTNFAISTGTNLSSIPFAQGTVAGIWTISLTSLTDVNGFSVLPTPAPSITVTVAPAAPIIMPGSVQVVNKTSTGFSVQFSGYSDIRAVTSANFQFAPGSGTSLQGPTSINVPFNGSDQSGWYATPASLAYGGNFSLQVPFSFSGDISALGAVTVTLTNADGPSVPVTGQ
jgi:streptogramin lyase